MTIYRENKILTLALNLALAPRVLSEKWKSKILRIVAFLFVFPWFVFTLPIWFPIFIAAFIIEIYREI